MVYTTVLRKIISRIQVPLGIVFQYAKALLKSRQIGNQRREESGSSFGTTFLEEALLMKITGSLINGVQQIKA